MELVVGRDDDAKQHVGVTASDLLAECSTTSTPCSMGRCSNGRRRCCRTRSSAPTSRRRRPLRRDRTPPWPGSSVSRSAAARRRRTRRRRSRRPGCRRAAPAAPPPRDHEDAAATPEYQGDGTTTRPPSGTRSVSRTRRPCRSRRTARARPRGRRSPPRAPRRVGACGRRQPAPAWNVEFQHQRHVDGGVGRLRRTANTTNEVLGGQVLAGGVRRATVSPRTGGRTHGSGPHRVAWWPRESGWPSCSAAGPSEHAISCVSAGSVLRALDRSRVDVVPIGLTPDGSWVLERDEPDRLRITDGVLQVDAARDGLVLAADPTRRELDVHAPGDLPGRLAASTSSSPRCTFGEDGTIQGLFEMAGFPTSLRRARLGGRDGQGHDEGPVRACGLEQAPYVVITDRRGWRTDRDGALAEVARLGLPVLAERRAPARAPRHQPESRTSARSRGRDRERPRARPRVVVEASVEGAREIECGVLVDEAGEPRASVCARWWCR